MPPVTEIHMIGGNNDRTICGVTRGMRTSAVTDVTCKVCRARIERMTYTEAYTIAQKVLDAARRGRFASRRTTSGRLRCEWLHVAREKAEVHAATQAAARRFAIEATEAAHEGGA